MSMSDGRKDEILQGFKLYPSQSVREIILLDFLQTSLACHQFVARFLEEVSDLAYLIPYFTMF